MTYILGTNDPALKVAYSCNCEVHNENETPYLYVSYGFLKAPWSVLGAGKLKIDLYSEFVSADFDRDRRFSKAKVIEKEFVFENNIFRYRVKTDDNKEEKRSISREMFEKFLRDKIAYRVATLEKSSEARTSKDYGSVRCDKESEIEYKEYVQASQNILSC